MKKTLQILLDNDDEWVIEATRLFPHVLLMQLELTPYKTFGKKIKNHFLFQTRSNSSFKICFGKILCVKLETV